MQDAADTVVCKCAGIKHWKCLERLWEVGSYTETCEIEAVLERVVEEGILCIWFLACRTVVGFVFQGLSHAGNLIYSGFN